jgi:hypothetical protein
MLPHGFHSVQLTAHSTPQMSICWSEMKTKERDSTQILPAPSLSHIKGPLRCCHLFPETFSDLCQNPVQSLLSSPVKQQMQVGSALGDRPTAAAPRVRSCCPCLVFTHHSPTTFYKGILLLLFILFQKSILKNKKTKAQ